MAPSTPDLVVVDSPLGSSIVGVELDGKSTCGSTDSSWPNDDPAVIVGMACRLPGDIRSPSELWNFLVEKKSAQGPVLPERYNINGFYDKVSRSGTSNVPGGYFIGEDVRSFDNAFFGINNLEATYMDPQQRKLLEVTYEALSNAGVTMESLSGSTTGVFVGNFSVDYQPNQVRDPDYLHRYISTGSGATIMSNRISHVFNLHGPSNTIDTACSSSIYALHQALNALNMNDCESVIVASSNLILSPELHVAAAKSGVLSPTGTCHTFDASADGYGRAEGINAIYIKRLSAALRDGNPIRAVIRGSAVNASGRTPGIALPSGEQQEVVMRKAYQNAGLDVSGTDYVECHGTGTPVGDPIEVNAVGRTFSPSDAPRQGPPLLVGSVKTNVGHSEGASGLTSILKVVQSFENGRIAPSQGITKLNPKLVLAERNVKIVQEMEEWPRALRRASINSFGYGGANAHVILEAPESYLGKDYLSTYTSRRIKSSGERDEQKLLVLPVSATSANSLEALVKQITHTVSQIRDAEELQSLAHTLSKGRDHLSHRSFVLAKHGESRTAKVVASDAAVSKQAADPQALGFVFTGQGAQYAGMAKELLIASQHFRDTIRGLDAVLRTLPPQHAPDWTLEQTLLDGADSRINHVTRSQPICTAVQIGLVEMLRSWGIAPQAVVGHSSGEIAAAYTAGHLTASQAILVAYLRGWAVGELKSKGVMMAAGLSPETAKQLIESKGLERQVRVACVNSPESVTLSGTSEGIEALRVHLQADNKFARKLETGGRAYHSHMMEEIGQLYEDLLAPFFKEDSYDSADAAAVEAEQPKMYSSVGHSAESLGFVDRHTYMPAYWRKNLEQPVQFSGALSNLVAANKKSIHLVEIGPHAALKGPIKQIRTSLKLSETALPYSASLVRHQDADICIKTLAGTLFTHGHPTIKWDAVNALPESGLRVLHTLAPYPWDYSGGILWSEPRVSYEMRNRKYIRHELLGTVALTGNDIDFTWRNILRLSEVPWLKDHKVEDTIVFPAVGYLAMAVEAVSQVTGAKEKPANDLAFEFRDVSISAALNVPAEERDIFNCQKDLEVHTTMSARKTSHVNTSADWYDFSVSSWLAGSTTVHCTGSIRVTEPDRGRGAVQQGVTVKNTDSFDSWSSTSKWYKKWDQEGLCFGPHFQSLTALHTDSRQVRREFIGVTRFQPPCASEKDSTTFYPVHPITIDATLQAAILSTTAGHVSTLKTWLPVFFAELRLQPALHDGHVLDATSEDQGKIHARSEETGFSSRKIEGTLRDSSGDVVVNIRGGKMALYNGKTAPVTGGDADAEGSTNEDGSISAEQYLKRQPTLRIQWKPDVLRLVASPEAERRLRDYVSAFVDQQHDDMRDDESLAVIGALLDLAGHKNPRIRVLELDGDALGYKAKQWQSVLDKETAFARVRSWHSATLTKNGDISVQQDAGEDSFDVLLIPRHATSRRVWDQAPERIVELVSDTGIIVTRRSDAARVELMAAGFDVLDVGKQVLLGVRPMKTTSLTGRNALIVHADQPSRAVSTLAKVLALALQQKAGVTHVNTLAINQVDSTHVTKTTICISLLEVEKEFLATISAKDMDRLRIMTDNTTDLLWLTGANMLGPVPDPNLTLSSGLSRALMLEQPTLRYSVLDIGKLMHTDATVVSDNAVKALTAAYDKDDAEFIEKDGLLHVSRYRPDFGVNSLFRRRMGIQGESVTLQPLSEAGPATLANGRLGALDTLHFKQQVGPVLQQQSNNNIVGLPGNSPPPAGQVDITVKAVGLSAKDSDTISGRADSRGKATAFEFSGIVTAVAHDVSHVRAGDRVVAYAPHQLGTAVRVPAGVVHKLLDHEEHTVVPTLLLAYATGLYAINERAHLRKGESILVHLDAGSNELAVAVISLAQRLGAVVYTTAGSQAKRDYLVNELDMADSHIFRTDGVSKRSFVDSLQQATGGRGVDVVINSLAGDVMHETWRCLAEFGRFVEIGRQGGLTDAGKLDMRVFLRNATFTAFELSELFYATDSFHRATWDRLMAETLELYRAKEIQPLPIEVFDVSQIVTAYKQLANKDRVGKIVVSLEDEHAYVPVAPATYLSVFNPDKVYLLVGCFGGLGRSISRWMMNRGARHFVFVGRSGADKPSARQLVTRLEEAGAHVTVVRGDVSKAADIIAAVETCVANGRRIGGVVQAAMGLHEALFTRMPVEAWHTGIDPKWQGTWNLHNAIQVYVDKDRANEPDFFLCTSSVSGTVGTATESNYCAANGFLDAFARWRRSRGQAGISVGLGMISEVGYLHENPEIEALLLRKGIQPINEEELLQIVDLALSSEAARRPTEAHMLTGLEPDAIRELSAQGFDVTTHGVLVEARASMLLSSLLAEKEALEAQQTGGGAVAVAAAAPWFKDIPAGLSATFAPEAHVETLLEAILLLVKKRFSNLILLPADQIPESRPLPSFGVDSMIASEFRSWFWSAFKVDIPFLDIMSAQTSLNVLADTIEKKLQVPA